MTHGIKEFYKRIKYRYKGCIKKRDNNCNWPQLNAYCGCLELSTGIYIGSVIVAVVVTLHLLRNCWIVVQLRIVRDEIIAGNFTEVEDLELDLDKIINLYRVIDIYLISWIVLFALLVMFILTSIYAVYQKKQKMLKIIIYIYIPFCVFELLYSFFIVIINQLHYGHAVKIVVLLCYVLELYNFLAIRSYYKRLRGKSLLEVEENSETRPPTASAQTRTIDQPPVFNESSIEMHCRSCTCFIQGNITIAEIVTTQPRSNEIVNGVDNQQPNQSAAESVQDTNSGRATGSEGRVIRPNTLDLSLETAKEDKIELSDAPVIYDEQQLNVGSSPVIQDRTI